MDRQLLRMSIKKRERIKGFFESRSRISETGRTSGYIGDELAAKPVKSRSLFDGGEVLYSYYGTLRIVPPAYDDLAQIFLVDLEELIFLSDVTLIGVPIGYSP